MDKCSLKQSLRMYWFNFLAMFLTPTMTVAEMIFAKPLWPIASLSFGIVLSAESKVQRTAIGSAQEPKAPAVKIRLGIVRINNGNRQPTKVGGVKGQQPIDAVRLHGRH